MTATWEPSRHAEAEDDFALCLPGESCRGYGRVGIAMLEIEPPDGQLVDAGLGLVVNVTRFLRDRVEDVAALDTRSCR